MSYSRQGHQMTGLVMGLDIVVCGAVHMHQTNDIDMYQVI